MCRSERWTCLEGWAPEELPEWGGGLGKIICGEQSLNFMSVHWEIWLGWHWGMQGIESVGSGTHYGETRHLQRRMLGWFLLPPPPRLRMRDVLLRGNVLCVGSR